MRETLTDPRFTDSIWPFVEQSRNAFDEAGRQSTNAWEPDTRDPIVEGVSIRRLTIVPGERPFTVAEVTQPIGVVIPPHRHHESHVLLRVIEGVIQVDCEGYSRRVEKGSECLIPKGFTHTVFALTNEGGAPAVYRSAHFEVWLTADDNRFLKQWPTEPRSNEPATELEVAMELIKGFLSLQPEYLTKHDDYRAWFYILHIDPDSKFPNVDQVGFAGPWENHQDKAALVVNRWKEAPEFRLGALISDPEWSNIKVYSPLFCAHQNKDKANEVSDFYAFRPDLNDERWELTHSNDSVVELLKKYEGNFQTYIRLLTKNFLQPTEYLIYVTPPQQPGLSGFLEETRRRPFSSLIVGVTHGSRDFIEALFKFFLICSSMIQQMRFAVRADITSIRFEEERRREFFINGLVQTLLDRDV